MNIGNTKNVIYNGIQEGVGYDLHLFTEKSTGGTFGIKTTVNDLETELDKRIKQLIESFK